MTVRELLDAAARLAREKGAEATAWDARILMAHALGESSPLALALQRDLPDTARGRFEELWQRRLTGAPVQHLIGEWDFYGRTFTVDGRGLVPRPETELLVAAALREAPQARWILDAGTGSGILAATLLLERPQARVFALDASLEALALARENRARHGLSGRMLLAGSDWLSALAPQAFDLAVSNPPYLALSQREGLSPTVRDHDPSRALFAGQDGLSAIRLLLETLPGHLTPGAPFLFELGFGQAQDVEREIRSRPAWAFVSIEPDLAGIPRVAVARKKKS
jgi:release factor glutamine methyltransferase